MSSYVRTAFLARKNEWLIKMFDEDQHPRPAPGFHVAQDDGSFFTTRPIRLSDFDENGWFRPDAPPGATVTVA